MYSSIDDAIAFDRVTSLLDDLKKLAGGLERWVKRILIEKKSGDTS